MSFGTVFVPGREMSMAKIRLHFLKYSMRETASLKLQMNICELKKPVDWKQEWYTIIKFKKPFFCEVIQK